MKFYRFRQNNSGGMFDGSGIVYVQAENTDEANKIAEENGIYFNGCHEGIDCDCCGDRWHETDSWDAEDNMTSEDFENEANGEYAPSTSPVIEVFFHSGDVQKFYKNREED